MSAYVARLMARAHGRLPVVQPRLPGQFEPAGGLAAGGGIEEADLRPESAVALRLSGSAPDQGTPISVVATGATTDAAPPPLSYRASRAGRGESTDGDTRTMQPARSAQIALTRPVTTTPLQATEPAFDGTTARPALPLSAPAMRPPLATVTPPAAALVSASAAPLNSPPKALADRDIGTVHVTIGRVDVRAVMPTPASPVRHPRPERPRRSLDDYLAGGRR